jgi:hypothetical protein
MTMDALLPVRSSTKYAREVRPALGGNVERRWLAASTVSLNKAVGRPAASAFVHGATTNTFVAAPARVSFWHDPAVYFDSSSLRWLEINT